MVNKQSAAVTGKIWGKTNPEIVEKLRDRTLNKDSYLDSEIYDKDQKERFYANEKAYEDLEIKELEIIVGGWEWSDWNRRYNLKEENLFRWGNFGHDLLNYLIRNPLIQREAIEYIQEGVRELALNEDLRIQLNELLTRKEGLFKTMGSFSDMRNSSCRVISFSNYQESLKQLSKVLSSAESDSLRDIWKSLDRHLRTKRYIKASEISRSRKHNLLITGGIEMLDRWGDKTRGYKVSYTTIEGKEVPVFYIEDRSSEYEDEEEKFNVYEAVWCAIKRVLGKEGFEALDDIAFDGAVLGYMNGLAGLVDLYEKNNIRYTFPKINSRERELFFRKANHPFLLSQNPTSNNVNLNSNPSLYVIAGANDGGKTTYAKLAGLLTILSQIGAPIPAEEARLSPFNNIYTHFTKTESVNSGQGRFVNELERLKFILENADRDSLVLLDEPCAGTSNEDAIDVSMDVIYGFQQIGCLTVYITHLHEIQQRLAEERYVNCRNLCVKTKGSERNPEFTYEITEGIAKKSYGKVFARKLLPVNRILSRRKLK